MEVNFCVNADADKFSSSSIPKYKVSNDQELVHSEPKPCPKPKTGNKIMKRHKTKRALGQQKLAKIMVLSFTRNA